MTLYFVVINRYASNLICIFMNINEDIRNKTKKYRKMKGSTNKISYKKAAKCFILENLVPGLRQDITAYI